jgi:hypothetical protein
MLAVMQQATNIMPKDWEITKTLLDDYIKAGPEFLRAGNRMGMMNILYGNTFKKGIGD